MISNLWNDKSKSHHFVSPFIRWCSRREQDNFCLRVCPRFSSSRGLGIGRLYWVFAKAVHRRCTNPGGLKAIVDSLDCCATPQLLRVCSRWSSPGCLCLCVPSKNDGSKCACSVCKLFLPRIFWPGSRIRENSCFCLVFTSCTAIDEGNNITVEIVGFEWSD